MRSAVKQESASPVSIRPSTKRATRNTRRLSTSPSENNEESSNDSQLFAVEKILKMRTKKGVKHYLIKWEGYPTSENTWEPRSNLKDAKEALAKFEADNVKRQKLDLRSKRMTVQPSKIPKKSARSVRSASRTRSAEPKPAKKIKSNQTIEQDKDEESEEDTVVGSNSSIHSVVTRGAKSGERRNLSRSITASAQGVFIGAESGLAAHSSEEDGADFSHIKYGSFAQQDRPRAIQGVDIDDNDVLSFTVDWEPRENGYKPLRSCVSDAEFRMYDVDFLMAYYKSKLVISSRVNEVRNMLSINMD